MTNPTLGRTRGCHRSDACMASCRVTLQDDELPRGGDVIHRFRVVLSGLEVPPGGLSNVSAASGLSRELDCCLRRLLSAAPGAATDCQTRPNQEGA
jgi:hypothetical protein